MIVDASAVLSIVLDEPDAPVFAEAIARSDDPWMSAVNWLEAAIRVDRAGDASTSRAFDRFTAARQIAIRPVTFEQAQLAREAHLSFGKGRHPARLNLGDCFAYALARESARPLLFKGGDFALTDIEPALPQG
jgi:ribonuclease VapC